MEVDELLEQAKLGGFGTRKQSVLKGLVCQLDEHGKFNKAMGFKRDGVTRVMTSTVFHKQASPISVDPISAHIIPDSIHNKVRIQSKLPAM
jgi:hypothetical protein